MRRLTFGVLLSQSAAVSLAGCGSRIQSALDPAGDHAASISTLWWLMFAVLVTVFVLVLLFLSRALARAPRLENLTAPRIATADDLRTWRGVAAAIGATVIILFVLLVASLITGARIASPATAETITIEIVGQQWWWEARYLHAEPDRIVTTANEIHIPVGVPVTFGAPRAT